MRSTFKHILQEDIREVFLDPEEFGEPHILNGEEVTLILDNNEMLEREKRYQVHQDGIFFKQILIYVALKTIIRLPDAGDILELDGELYRVVDAINEDGICSISLRMNQDKGRY